MNAAGRYIRINFPGALIVSILIMLCSLNSAAQYKFNVTGKEESHIYAELKKELKLPSAVIDSADGIRICRKILPDLYESGYLAASIDSIYIQDSVFTVLLYAGNIYRWAAVTSSIDREVVNQSGVEHALLRSKSVSPKALSAAMRKLLKWYGSNGYPFARVALTDVNVNGSCVNAVIKADKGELFYFDSLIIKGSSRLSHSYLSNYLGLKKGDLYNESHLDKISARLKEIPFVTEIRRKESEFTENHVRVIIYIDDKKASQFSGVVGVLPDRTNEGKVNVTGDVKLRLLNSFSHAELFDLNWSNPLPKSQDLKIKLNYPFLFDMPFGLDVNFSIFKKDSTFLELEREVGIQHYLQGNNYVKVFVGLRTSNLIATKGYENATVLPDFADVSTTTYGIGWHFEKLDYRLNPRRGYSIEAQVGAGTKTITKNNRVNDELYDSLDLRTNHYNGRGQGDVYFPVRARGVFNIGTMGGWLFSPDIFENELYRFGGLKTLRGFNELSINASQYIIGKMEYRYILEQNSYLFLFGNMAYYENRSRNKFIHDTPYGYGAGITFETKLGIFSFTYALGKEFDNPVLIKDGKIHFGLVNYF
jgi:outer membrane protein assembly factor BamA